MKLDLPVIVGQKPVSVVVSALKSAMNFIVLANDTRIILKTGVSRRFKFAELLKFHLQ